MIRSQIIATLTQENLIQLIPKLYTKASSFQFQQEDNYDHFLLFNLCRFMPSQESSEAISFMLEGIFFGEDKMQLLSSERYPTLFLFLKQYSNEVCYQAFDKFFGKNEIVKQFLKCYTNPNRILFDFIQSRNFGLIKDIVEFIHETAKLSEEEKEKHHFYEWSQILSSRQLSQFTRDRQASVVAANFDSEEDWDMENDSDESANS